MRTPLSLLVVLLILAPTLGVSSTEQQSSDIEFRAHFYLSKSSNNTLLGEVELWKSLSIKDVEVNSTLKAYARLASLDGNMNFSLELKSNTTIAKKADGKEIDSLFKLSYTDYGILAKLVQSNQAVIEANGSTKIIKREERLNTTFNAMIKPSTGNTMMDAVLAYLLASVLNETLKEFKKELEGAKPDTSLEYKVILNQEKSLVLLNVNLSTRTMYKVYNDDISSMRGFMELYITANLKQNMTILQADVKTDTLKELNLGEALNMLANIHPLNTSKIDTTLNNINTVLQTTNLLLTTLSDTIENIHVEAPRTPQTTEEYRTPGEGRLQESTQPTTRTMTEQESRQRVTPTLVLVGVLIVLVIAISYIMLTMRPQSFPS